MRTTTIRGLAAGAGVAAVLLAGATSASADESTWVDHFTDEGWDNVACGSNDYAAGTVAVALNEDLYSSIPQDYEWAGLVLVTEDGESVVESPEPGEYRPKNGEPVVEAVSCIGVKDDAAAATTADDVADDTATEDSTADPTESDDPAGATGGEGADDSATTTGDQGSDDTASDDDASDEAATDAAGSDDQGSDDEESATGPAVETDGPATAGPNLGLLGGAFLAVAGAGAAGWAMRRRPEAR